MVTFSSEKLNPENDEVRSKIINTYPEKGKKEIKKVSMMDFVQ